MVSGLYLSRPLRMVSMFSGRSGATSNATPIVEEVGCVVIVGEIVDRERGYLVCTKVSKFAANQHVRLGSCSLRHH